MLPAGEGEKVPLGGAMKARGGPEGWLTAVEALMRSALRAAAKRAIKDYPVLPRAQWVRQQPAQLVLLVSNIFWCKQVTDVNTRCSTSINCATYSMYKYTYLNAISKQYMSSYTCQLYTCHACTFQPLVLHRLEASTARGTFAAANFNVELQNPTLSRTTPACLQLHRCDAHAHAL